MGWDAHHHHEVCDAFKSFSRLLFSLPNFRGQMAVDVASASRRNQASQGNSRAEGEHGQRFWFRSRTADCCLRRLMGAWSGVENSKILKQSQTIMSAKSKPKCSLLRCLEVEPCAHLYIITWLVTSSRPLSSGSVPNSTVHPQTWGFNNMRKGKKRTKRCTFVKRRVLPLCFKCQASEHCDSRTVLQNSDRSFIAVHLRTCGLDFAVARQIVVWDYQRLAGSQLVLHVYRIPSTKRGVFSSSLLTVTAEWSGTRVLTNTLRCVEAGGFGGLRAGIWS